MSLVRVLSPRPSAVGSGTLLLLAAVLVGSVGCGSDSSGPGGNVVSVAVNPSTPTLTAIGSTAQLAASARNAKGSALSGATFEWSSSNPGVATVSPAGLVTAVGNGASIVTATATGTSVSGTALITVEQEASSVSVSPPEASVEAGQTVQLSATATDAGGANIPDATFTWTSSDDAVATVTASGLVSAVSDGSVTITANSGMADGTTDVTVLRADVEITQDMELSGEVRADIFRIAPGVTVTATGDLTIDAEGYVEILGSLIGDCVSMTIQGDTAVTVGGTIHNGCTVGVEGRDLSIEANGELTLEDATIVSAGDITFKNDPSLTADGIAPPASAMESVSGGKEPERAGHGIYWTLISGTTVGYAGTAARDGLDGSPAEAGEDGHSITFILRGDTDVTGNTLVWAQDGGNGGDTEVSSAGEVTASAGSGGSGGGVGFVQIGVLSFTGADNVIRGGSGGMGGSATAMGLPNSQGAKAPTAQATGGAGGMSGIPEFTIRSGEITVAQTGSLTLEVGLPGDGGDAAATGAAGRDAESNAVPAQEGGDVVVAGGAGGNIPSSRPMNRDDLLGSDPVIRGAGGAPLDGGDGGKATGTAGNGGNGILSNKPGANGADLYVQGGGGGSSQLNGLDGELLGSGGAGGLAEFFMGNGGNGFSDCVAGQPSEAGGQGGAGGNTTGNGGLGGTGVADGLDGGTWFENVGNGGAGGSGVPPGFGGAKGSRGSVSVNSTDVNPVFTDGQSGTACSVGERKEFRVAFEETSHTVGSIASGVTQLLGVDEVGGGLRGYIPVTPSGQPFAFTYNADPPRWGMAGGQGNQVDFDLSSLVVPGATVIPVSLSICIHNAPSATPQNPIFYHFLDAQGGNLGTVANGNPGTFPCTPMIIPDRTATVRIQFLVTGSIEFLAPTLYLDIYQ